MHGAGQLSVPRGRCVRFRGLCKLENVHGLQIKASFFQISSKACCGSEQLEQLRPPLPETTAVSTTQSSHCYQRQIWSRHFKCGHLKKRLKAALSVGFKSGLICACQCSLLDFLVLCCGSGEAEAQGGHFHIRS